MKERWLANPTTIGITIEKVVYGGAGLGRCEGKVVFVPFSTAGDRLVVRPVKQKKNLIWASIERIVEAGPARTAPFCAHFGVCGGCQWQHMQYSAQVEAKRSILEELFHHRFPATSKLTISMKPSPEAQGYRSRARIQLRGHGSDSGAGFFALQSHDVVDVAMCPLLRPSLNEALATIRDLWKQGKVDPGTRQVELVCSQEESKWSWAEVERDLEEGFYSLGKSGETEADCAPLIRRVGEFEYKVAPQVFFQANDFMISELLATVQELGRVPKPRSALDLFAGVGLFSLPIARSFTEVTAVESSPAASRLCDENAVNCGLSNIRVVCADVAAWMKAVASVAAPSFDMVLLDPPRTGAGSDIMQTIGEWAPETILYISCDPQTLVRDLAFLPMRDYRIDFVQGLDLFPQTYHFETVVRLKRR
jgi:23S rRNA (uracil1939-C5)-methyltransferase